MEFLAKNVQISVKILTGWVVGLLRCRGLQASSEADKRKLTVCHDFLGKRYGFDNIDVRPWTKQLTHALKITPVI